MSVLFVFTSAFKTLLGNPTGWYLPEAAHPYYVLEAANAKITFASPNGPNPPIDEDSVRMFKDDVESQQFLNDKVVQAKLASAKKLSEIDPSKFDAIFYVGGHGPVLDLSVDPVNIKLASAFLRENKIVSAVCHGPAALVNVTDASGKNIFAGRTATGFSNVEEEQADKVKDLPWLLEDKIRAAQGTYVKATKPWEEKVVVDGKVITGQNPASAKGVGEAIKAALNLTA